MAKPTKGDSQVTDSVIQANAKFRGYAPVVALGNLYQATAQALSNAAHNATSSQQQGSDAARAAMIDGISPLYTIDTASTAAAPAKILA